MFLDQISLIFFSSICISWRYLMHYCKPATSCIGKIRPHAMVLTTDYGRPTKPFFIFPELLGLGRQIRQINAEDLVYFWPSYQHPLWYSESVVQVFIIQPLFPHKKIVFKLQRADLTCHVTRDSHRLCCVDQSGTSIQILPEPRDTFFIKLRLYIHITNIYLGFEFWPQRIRDLVFGCQ